MHRFGQLTFYCIFIAAFSCVTARTDGQTLISNVKAAILSALVETYNGTNGTLNSDQLKLLINASVRERHFDNVNTSKADAEEINENCCVSCNISFCKDVISKKCFNRHVLSTIYASDELTDWTAVFPALVYHRVSNACSRAEEGSHNRDHPKTPPYIAWAYGLGFSVLIVVVSNIGCCMVPLRKKLFFHRILMFCVALAAGTLAGTGFLVLIPESMHLTGKDTPIPGYYYKLATTLCGIYFFYVMERLLKALMKRNKKKKKKHTTTPVEDDIPKLANGETHHSPEDEIDFTTLKIRKGADGPQRKVNPVAWLVLLGDALHNFVDGLSIGAAFTVNIYTGISVSIAILCEELPHELGDIAILHHAGLSLKRALVYNFLVALTVLIGCVLGVLLGGTTHAAAWIFACAGGMFIYISLVNILPEMSEQAKHVIEQGLETPLVTAVIQNFGLVLGFAIIFLLAIFGQEIHV